MSQTTSEAERKFVEDFKKFSEFSKQAEQRFELNGKDCYPCLSDKTETTSYDRHYIYHTAWAARCLAASKPELHIDISSSLFFCSIASAFVPVKFFDFRPPDLKLKGLEVGQADLHKLSFASESVASLSCMHVVEHIGLGRYGDPLDYDGDLKAILELKRVLKPGGELLFVVPLGKSKIEFNAHRIYSYDQVMKYFEGYTLKEFALIPDNPTDGRLIIGASKALADQQKYACGCFWFVKK